MKKISWLISISILCCSLPLWAQDGQVYTLNMKEILIYVLPFYIITFIALALFLNKLIRPKTSNKWLYLFTIIGTLGAAIVTYQFKKIQDEQLPQVVVKDNNPVYEPNKLSLNTQQKLDRMNTEVRNQQYANFWIIGMPNIILLVLGLVVDRVQKREEK